MKSRRLLRLRRLMNQRRPTFVRMNMQGLLRIKEAWRRPRGLDNKIRIERKGYPAKVKVGFRGPREVRGLHPCGLVEVLVHSADELDKLDPSKHCVRIASILSRRKKREVAERAAKIGLKVLNYTLSEQ
ncbi:MAG: 50S ribosomal protein L32e [Candidatus Nezhaarchaeota archaeon]|nr:50S ribosomal protein L32e [Candidatus Nezhaarchaeota archaeon]